MSAIERKLLCPLLARYQSSFEIRMGAGACIQRCETQCVARGLKRRNRRRPWNAPTNRSRVSRRANPASGAEIARQNALDTDRVHPLPRRRVRPRRIDGSARILDDHDIEARCSRILRRPRDAEIGRKPGEEYARQAPLAKIACEARRRHAIDFAKGRVAVDVVAESLAYHELRMHDRKIRENAAPCVPCTQWSGQRICSPCGIVTVSNGAFAE